MKSKAQEYLDWKKQVVPERPVFGSSACVDDDGNLCLLYCTLSPRMALKLRDWLTDTFDVPKQTHYPLVGRD